MSEQSKADFVRACPEFLYLAAPEPKKTRFVFKDRVALSLGTAYAYAVELHEAKLVEAVKAMFKEEAWEVKEIKDISAVFGPLVTQRNYRVSLDDTIEGQEWTADFNVQFDEDWQVTTADEYNRVI